MTPRSSFFRKRVPYLAAIMLLLLPLHWLSHPATSAAKGSQGSPGGKLAQLRESSRLSQAQLGQIDPTSVTIKLATLGLRGVAANILWEKANDYKMKKDWTNLSATLVQLTKVQPNFVTVWSHQGWNLAYNVSASFDDYRERYRWCIKGIEFLKEGTKYNDNEPRLLWDMGWTLSNRLGRADEHVQFRRLFKEDDDFHGSRPQALRDNWLVGKERFDEAVDSFEKTGRTVAGKPVLYFLSNGPSCLMYYAEALESDGTFGEVAKRAWVDASEGWHRYGDKDIPTHFLTADNRPVVLRLNDQEKYEAIVQEKADQVDAIQPGLRQTLLDEKQAGLTDTHREALKTPPHKRTAEQFQLILQAETAGFVGSDEVARRITGPRRREAIQLAKEGSENQQMVVFIKSSRGTVNFCYWRLHAHVEQSDEMLNARRLFHQGDRSYDEGDLIAARDAYLQGFESCRQALDANKAILAEDTHDEALVQVIGHYYRVLGQLDEPFPEKFILQDILDQRERVRHTPYRLDKEGTAR